MNTACNGSCYKFRPHSDSNYVVCVTCGEIYEKTDLKSQSDLADQAQYNNEVGTPWDPLED